MEFKLREEDIETCEVGDFVLCDDNVYMIVTDDRGYFVLVNLNSKCVSSSNSDYETIPYLIRDQFKNMQYRIIKNDNVSFIES